MQALKAIYDEGNIKLLEKPNINQETEVLVIFPDRLDRKETKDVNGEELFKLHGIISIGGDAIEDSEKLYE